jgi:hypothetical protein
VEDNFRINLEGLGCDVDSPVSGEAPVLSYCEGGYEYSGSKKGGILLRVERLVASQEVGLLCFAELHKKGSNLFLQ